VQKEYGHKELDSVIDEAVRLHGHLGPFLVIGARMGYVAKKLLKGHAKRDLILNATIRVPMIVPFSCTIDGIQVTTHCTVGNQRLSMKSWAEGVHGSFTSEGSEKSVDIHVRREVIEQLKKKMSEGATNEELAKQVLQLPESKLFAMTSSEPLLHKEKSDEAIEDLKTAKNRLTNNNVNLCIMKGGKILFESRSHGVAGFLKAVEKHEGNLEGSCIADKIVGKAIALLCVHFKIGAVYADTLSRPAETVFERFSLYAEYGSLVDNVLDAKRTSLCPFEQLIRNVLDPDDAYKKLVNCDLVRRSKTLQMRSG
jgi:formylmethanofuran dehydrogenase subunit E